MVFVVKNHCFCELYIANDTVLSSANTCFHDTACYIVQHPQVSFINNTLATNISEQDCNIDDI
jgi:hypothetical protein